MKAVGGTPESIAAYRARLIAEVRQKAVEIFPENWHAFKVFLAMGSQWRITAGFGGKVYEGLDYGSLPIVLAEHRGITPRQPLHALMPQLRTLEGAARDTLNED